MYGGKFIVVFFVKHQSSFLCFHSPRVIVFSCKLLNQMPILLRSTFGQTDFVHCVFVFGVETRCQDQTPGDTDPATESMISGLLLRNESE